MRLAGLSLRRGAALLAMVMLSGCEGLFGPDTEVYTLSAVNGKALPTALDDTLVEVVSGRLSLDDEDSFTLTLVHRCNPNPPPGTGCQLNDGGKQTYTGTYSRSEGTLRFGTVVMEARFQGNQALLTFRCTDPASCFPRPFTIEYDFRR